MRQEMNRRDAIALGITSVAAVSVCGDAEAAVSADAASLVVRRHDARLQEGLQKQVRDVQSRWCGSIPDQWGLHHCHRAAGLLRDAATAYFHPQSRYHAQQELVERMKLAAAFLVRSQNDSGNIDLVTTNFNSPPDTGFVVHRVATAAKLARLNGDKGVFSLLEEFLRRAGLGLIHGGIHTPNHRWVVCAALAQIHDLLPDARYIKRIDQWLSEGIDIDEEGQFTERSTAGYNSVVDSALVVIAHKLKRAELLDAVRKNLDAMAYLLHPNGEVVTEISSRQDLNTRGTMSGYWFVLRYMALRDGEGLYASMVKPLEPESIELSRLMEYPELNKRLPAPTAVPDDYERAYPLSGITRIRRGRTSATILHKGQSRWICLRQGEAVVNAIRLASAFFGKGQFIPAVYERRGDGFYFRQELTGRYFQPIDDPSLLPVVNAGWSRLKMKRKTTEICRMVYEARLQEIDQGFEVFIVAQGTGNVPLAVEINVREGGELTGVTGAPHSAGAFLLEEGFAEYRMGSDGIRFGPGRCEHAYVQVRGAEGKLSGPSVYLTGYTPFQHRLAFEML